MDPLLNIAVKAARGAGDILIRDFARRDIIKAHEKTLYDFVSEVDIAAEEEIVGTIKHYYSDHSINAEEQGKITTSSEYTWIIDPLDGTANYLHGFPHFSISIAVLYKNEIIHGVVYDPFKEELFTASRGGGAFLNNRRLKIKTPRKTLKGALLATGFPFRDRGYLNTYLKIFSNFFQNAGDIRRTGSAALDLAYVASGRLDGFWEKGLKAWDIAAGIALVKEAGGSISDFSGKTDCLYKGEIVASSNHKLHQEMLTCFSSAAEKNNVQK